MNATETTIRTLKAQKEVLEAAIVALERVPAWATIEESPLGSEISPEATALSQERAPLTDQARPGYVPGQRIEGPTSAVTPMVGWEACRLVLERGGEAMTVPQIVAGFEKEGLQIGSRDRRAYVSTTLRRRDDIFARFGEHPNVTWGLREWTIRRK